MASTTTVSNCAQCPFYRPDNWDTPKGICRAPHQTGQLVKAGWAPTDICFHQLAKYDSYKDKLDELHENEQLQALWGVAAEAGLVARQTMAEDGRAEFTIEYPTGPAPVLCNVTQERPPSSTWRCGGHGCAYWGLQPAIALTQWLKVKGYIDTVKEGYDAEHL